jgi:hypothetical protein
MYILNSTKENIWNTEIFDVSFTYTWNFTHTAKNDPRNTIPNTIIYI